MRGSKKFRRAGIKPSLCIKFERIFSNSVATRQYVWTPSLKVLFDDDTGVHDTQDGNVDGDENLKEKSGDTKEDDITNYTQDVCNLVVGVNMSNNSTIHSSGKRKTREQCDGTR